MSSFCQDIVFLRVLYYIAHAAVELHAIREHSVHELATVGLDHRHLFHAIAARSVQPGGEIDKLATCFDPGLAISEALADRLFVPEYATKRLALFDVIHRHVERDLRLGAGHRAQNDAFILKVFHPELCLP